MISSSKISNIEKLFWIQRFLIKALWDIETKSFILLDSQMASTFEMSFAKEWIRLIGLKSSLDYDMHVQTFGSRIAIESSFDKFMYPQNSFWKRALIPILYAFQIYFISFYENRQAYIPGRQINSLSPSRSNTYLSFFPFSISTVLSLFARNIRSIIVWWGLANHQTLTLQEFHALH